MTEEEFSRESLQKSVKLIGELYPILENQDGKILDGDHRVKANPKHYRKTVQTKNRAEEILVRLHAHHRRRISQEETRGLIAELAGELVMQGTPKTEVAGKLVEALPYTPNYVRELLSEEYKNPEKVQAGKVGAQLTEQKKEQTVKTQETPQQIRVPPSEDFRPCMHQTCGKLTHITRLTNVAAKGEKPFDVCPICRVNFYRHAVQKVAETKTSKPIESWTQRKAQMNPQHSKMEDNLYKRLKEAGFDVEIDHFFCAVGSKPDFYFIKENTIAYIDGEDVHKDEEEDSLLRNQVAMRNKLRLLEPFRYKTWSQAVEDDLFKRIVSELSFGEENK